MIIVAITQVIMKKIIECPKLLCLSLENESFIFNICTPDDGEQPDKTVGLSVHFTVANEPL